MANSKAREKFITLAEKRVTKTIKDLRLIGNLSNKSNYSYDDNDVKKIISVLETEVKNLKQKFTTPPDKDEVIFKLD